MKIMTMVEASAANPPVLDAVMDTSNTIIINLLSFRVGVPVFRTNYYETPSARTVQYSSQIPQQAVGLLSTYY